MFKWIAWSTGMILFVIVSCTLAATCYIIRKIQQWGGEE